MRKENASLSWKLFWFSFLMVFAFGLLAADAPTTGADQRIFRWYPFLAPFHSVVLHFPIGFLMMAVILEFYRWLRPSQELKNVVSLVVWCSLLSAIITACFGVLRAGGGGYDERAVTLHKYFGISVPVCTLLTLAAQSWAYRSEVFGRTLAYRGLLFITLNVLILAGHLGGNLTHGSGYLVENAPAFLRNLMEPGKLAAPKPEVGNEHQQFFLTKVQPIFKAKCQSCHGLDKHKGEYRLDLPGAAFKGGESGQVAIKPGDVTGSNLARKILLPKDSEDLMPPSGKEQLTSIELITILQWIRDGAVFVADSPAPVKN